MQIERLTQLIDRIQNARIIIEEEEAPRITFNVATINSITGPYVWIEYNNDPNIIDNQVSELSICGFLQLEKNKYLLEKIISLLEQEALLKL